MKETREKRQRKKNEDYKGTRRKGEEESKNKGETKN